MFIATVIVTILLSAALIFTAARKLGHQAQVVETYRRVEVPEERLNYLAIILFAGAAGLLIGLFWAPLGIAASIGLVCYFVLAIVAHIRHRDTKNLPTPVVYLALSITVLALQLASR